jgi:hypothetical protein
LLHTQFGQPMPQQWILWLQPQSPLHNSRSVVEFASAGTFIGRIE